MFRVVLDVEVRRSFWRVKVEGRDFIIVELIYFLVGFLGVLDVWFKDNLGLVILKF